MTFKLKDRRKRRPRKTPAPLEIPQEVFDGWDREVLDQARGRIDPVEVAVLYLVRAGLPDSPITWVSEFGDGAGTEEMTFDAHNFAPFLEPHERLELRILRATETARVIATVLPVQAGIQ